MSALGHMEGWQLGLLVVAGLANYTLGRSFYYAGIRRIGAARASTLGAAWVVFAALLAVPLFGEPLTPRLVLGLGLVLVGGLLVSR
jgi:drug/metabolite transporter (DMT)-like permease